TRSTRLPARSRHATSRARGAGAAGGGAAAAGGRRPPPRPAPPAAPAPRPCARPPPRRPTPPRRERARTRPAPPAASARALACHAREGAAPSWGSGPPNTSRPRSRAAYEGAVDDRDLHARSPAPRGLTGCTHPLAAPEEPDPPVRAPLRSTTVIPDDAAATR